MSDHLTHAMFVQQRDTLFQVERQDEQPAVLELVDVEQLRIALPYESFSLVFLGPSTAFLPQAMYFFHHEVLGTFDLFITPIRQDARGFSYEAVFNRLHRDS